MLAVLSIASRDEFIDRLHAQGTLLCDWEVRPEKVWDDYESGEVRFLDYRGSICCEKDKVRLRILGKRPEGLRFLQESRMPHGAFQLVPRSLTTSVSGKRRIFRCNRPETIFECVERELGEELKITGVNVKRFSIRYREKAPDGPEPSTSCPGLYKLVTKHGLEWEMPREYQLPQFVDEHTYGISQFDWIEPCAHILQDRSQRKKRRVA